MKKKIEIQKIIKLLSAAIGIFITSKVPAFVNLIRTKAYIQMERKSQLTKSKRSFLILLLHLQFEST
jgi:hypothetical protein